jgi:hypothetical protein
MRALLAIPLLLLCPLLMGQERSIENIRKVRFSQSGAIQENQQLVGYYSFYQYDKVDSKTNAYHLDIFDTNLNEVTSVKMKKPRTTYLLEMVYNGETFALLFMDTKAKEVRMEAYDRTGKKAGQKVLADQIKFELMRMQQAGEGGEVNQSIYPMGNTGFVKQLMVKKKKYSYELHGLGSDMSKKWTYSPKESGMIDVCNIVWASDKYILCTTYQQKNAFDKPDHAFALLIDAETGKKVFEKKMTESGHNLNILNAYVDADKGHIMALGEYYASKDNVITSKSQGLYAMEMSLDGEVGRISKFDWLKDIQPHMPLGKKGDPEDIGWLFFHRVLKTEDGSHYLVGEQFKKAISGLGVASQVLSRGGGSSSAFSLKIDNMVLIKLSPDLAMESMQVIEKTRSEVTLPRGAAYWSPMLIAHYVRSIDGFDYAYTVTDKEKNRFFSTYVDFDRSKGDDGKKIGTYVGTIVHDNGNISVDKMPLSSKGTQFKIWPAKPGFIAVSEYFKKEKKITFRLEKVNF